MKRLSSIFKKEKPRPPAISKRKQLQPGEVWKSETPAASYEQLPPSASSDLQATLDEIVNQKYQTNQQLKILEEEEQKIIEKKKKVEAAKKKHEEDMKKLEEDMKKIEEDEENIKLAEKKLEEYKKKIKDNKKKLEEEEEEED